MTYGYVVHHTGYDDTNWQRLNFIYTLYFPKFSAFGFMIGAITLQGLFCIRKACVILQFLAGNNLNLSTE